jgi:hypothetical protein
MHTLICSHGLCHCHGLYLGHCCSHGRACRPWCRCTECLGHTRYRTGRPYPSGLRSRTSHPPSRLSNHTLASAPGCGPVKRTGLCLWGQPSSRWVGHQLAGQEGQPSVWQAKMSGRRETWESRHRSCDRRGVCCRPPISYISARSSFWIVFVRECRNLHSGY